ncbi:MAG: tetratricopeptide repeat protein [Treponema sp.]|jgi:tetratricopeptide (TPR) repeat protein|nr:tetratricopeptide repeat protein [Treponema sp.]
MVKTGIRSAIGGILKKQAFQGVAALFILAGAVIVFAFLFRTKARDLGLKRELVELWGEGDYAGACQKSREALNQSPMDPLFLTIHGFASYQMAASQINNDRAFEYVGQCVWSLRKALLGKNPDRDGKIRYVLGKAYYIKGPDYADLAVKYLEEARAARYEAGDLNEYLGQAYAALRNYQESVNALRASLSPEEEGSDLLFLSIAQSYMGLEDWEAARTYLTRCVEISRDAGVALKAKLLLGKVLSGSGDMDGALAAFEEVLESDENAEAAYELGEIYAARGDTIKARAAWRRSWRADPNYTPAQLRL